MPEYGQTGLFTNTVNPNDQRRSTGSSASGAGATGNYLQGDGSGTTWMRPYGGDNTTWMYGAQAPTAGVDQRAWNNIYNPNAYQYGGEVGGAGIEQRRYAKMGEAAQQRTGPQMDLGAFNQNMSAEDQSRNVMMRGLDMSETAAMGRGPSVAAAQLQAGQSQNMRNALQLAASGRGGGAGLVAAQQSAQAQNQAASTATNFQAATLRAQEQQQAMQLFNQQATAMRAADLQRAGMSAQMAYQQAGLEANQRAQNQQAQLAYEGMRQGVFNSQMQGQQAGEQQNSGYGLSAAQLQFQKDSQSDALRRQLIGAGLQGAGTILGGMVGGPVGAAAGNAGGKALGGAVNNNDPGY